jgi:predicted phosphoribosyltransferase
VTEVVVVAVPKLFWAVGQLYDTFEPVSTEEVCVILRAARRRRRASAA